MYVVVSLGRGAEGHGASAWLAGGVPAEGQLDSDVLDDVRQRIRDATRPAAGLAARSDVAQTTREQDAADALAELLTHSSMRAIGHQLARAAGRSEGRRSPLVLAIDAASPALRALPWELLESARHAPWAGAACRVVRLVEGRQRPPRAVHGLSVHLWTPTPDDPRCAEGMQDLTRSLADLPSVRCQIADPLRAPLPEVSLAVLHVIAHGARVLDAVGWTSDDGRPRSAEAARHLLGPHIEASDLVLLDVCEASDGDGGTDAPAWRIAAAGAPVVGPRLAWSTEAAPVFRGAVYAALAAGAPWLEAISAGRAALRALGHPHPSGRWWNPVVLTTGEPTRVARPAPTPRRAVWAAGLGALVIGGWWALRPGPVEPAVTTPAEAALQPEIVLEPPPAPQPAAAPLGPPSPTRPVQAPPAKAAPKAPAEKVAPADLPASSETFPLDLCGAGMRVRWKVAGRSGTAGRCPAGGVIQLPAGRWQIELEPEDPARGTAARCAVLVEPGKRRLITARLDIEPPGCD